MLKRAFFCDTLRGMKLSNFAFLACFFTLGSEAYSQNLDLPCKSQIGRFLKEYKIDTSNPKKKDGVTTYTPSVEPAQKAAYDAALEKAKNVGVPVTRKGFDDVSGPPLYITGYGSDILELWSKSARIEEKKDGLVKIKISGYQKIEASVLNPKTRLNERAVKLVYRENERIIDLKKSGNSCDLAGFQQMKTYVSAECCQKIYDKDLDLCKKRAKGSKEANEGELTKEAKKCITTNRVLETNETFLTDGVQNCRSQSCGGGPRIFASMLPPKSSKPPKPSGQGKKEVDLNDNSANQPIDSNH